MTTIKQLVDIYFKLEGWHKKKLSVEDSFEYFIRLLSQGNIIIFMDDDKVCGYIEFFRITPLQFRKILDKDFYVFDENITDGEICYISNMFILKEYRRGLAMNYLKTIFKNINRDCKYFVGHNTRRNNRVRIRENIWEKTAQHKNRL